MPSLPKGHSGEHVPPAIRPLVRASAALSVALIVAFLLEFGLFRAAKISNLTFGMSIAGTIAIYTIVSQLVRQAARKRGARLTNDERSTLDSRSLKTLRQQKQLNTVLLCMFSLGAFAVMTNVVLNHQSIALVLVPTALLSFGIWYRRALNRAIDTLEQRNKIDTLRGL